MKKKAPRKKARLWLLKILGGWFGILGILFLSFLFLHHTKPFCANSISCITDLSGKVRLNQTTGTFLGQKITVPTTLLSELSKPAPVLGAETGNHVKKIYVDLTSQHLFAAEDGHIIYDFPVSTGKWHPTPTGIFHIWVKLQAVRMSGGSGADGYDLPNVPWTMFFAGDNASASQGFSIHGAYWHNNFGHPMSHGCVNMRIADAKTLFDWADPPTTGYTTSATSQNPGTEVDIYGEAPLE